MKCPVCDATLRQVSKYGVEVDICPDCKGVWLDRGELEKIIQMVSEDGPSQAVDNRMAEERPREYREQPREQMDRHDHDHDHGHENERYREDHRQHDDRSYDPRTGKPKKKESWLTQIFDSFGGGED